jgi:hypothetical protein
MHARPKRFYWILGIATALGGVAIAKLIGPQLPADYRSMAFIVGTTLAITGIFVSGLGAGRRVSQHSEPAGKNKEP